MLVKLKARAREHSLREEGNGGSEQTPQYASAHRVTTRTQQSRKEAVAQQTKQDGKEKNHSDIAHPVPCEGCLCAK
jgi:hypothetical protein